MDIYKDLNQFRDCAGRPEKEGFLVSKDQVSFPDHPAEPRFEHGIILDLETYL